MDKESIIDRDPGDDTGQERLLLNVYGRKCYEAGEKAARAPLLALVKEFQRQGQIRCAADLEAALCR